MKRERKSRYCNRLSYDEYHYTDTRYFGVWVYGTQENMRVKVDPKRFTRSTGKQFSEEQLAVINKRRSTYFYPAKPLYFSYNCNVFFDTIYKIRAKWLNHFQPLVKIAIERIKQPRRNTAGDSDLFMQGIIDCDEANIWASVSNEIARARYQRECNEVVASLYAQFLHLLASQIEAVTVKVLTKEKALTDRFDRNIFYATAVGKEKTPEQLPSFKYYDKLYCIWNFIKHNSGSTYNTLKGRYPEALCDSEYKQGELAVNYLRFTDSLVLQLIDGCAEFFKEYCELVFGENYAEAQWNYGGYFVEAVDDKMDDIDNPLGLPDFI